MRHNFVRVATINDNPSPARGGATRSGADACSSAKTWWVWRAHQLSRCHVALSFGVITTTLLFLSARKWDRAYSKRAEEAQAQGLFLGDAPLELAPTPINVALRGSKKRLAAYADIVSSSSQIEPEPLARSRLYHMSHLSALMRRPLPWLVRDKFEFRILRAQLPNLPLTTSWRGLEPAESSETIIVEHRDQLLATLAEAGAPLSCEIHSANGVYLVRDLLLRSLGDFHLGQAEISWSTLAYVRYLPPQLSWKNRLSEEFTFDQLAKALMGRSLSSESCRGTHLVIAMTHLLLADGELSILSGDVRTRLKSHLRMRVREAVESQLADGSWPVNWTSTAFHSKSDQQFTPPTTASARLLVAGHLLEWFHFLPQDLKPSDSTVKLGISWLWSRLNSASKEGMSSEFCAFTHAILALELATSFSK